MAARRLVIVMIVLLAISTAVAVIAPQPAQRTGVPEAETTTAPPPEDAGWAGAADHDRLHSVVNTDRDEIPKRIVALVGDRLRLEVRGGPGRTVSIPDLGLVEIQSRTAPASFDLLFEGVGGYEVIDVESGEKLALIVVQVGERDEPEASPADPGDLSEPPTARPGASSQAAPV